MRDTFSTLHPIIIFTYFIGVIAVSIITMHPILLILSLACSAVYSVYLNRLKTLKFFLFLLPVFLFITLINPLFNHTGNTILLYISGNPITLEALVYGLFSAVALLSVILWFSCYNVVMTTEKFIFLFERIIPSLSLIFSMILRLVPKYNQQIKIIGNAQKGIGRDPSRGSLSARIKNGLAILSILVTWSLENAISTSDSMRARGYGTGKRTSFARFRFDARDALILGAMLLLFATIIAGALGGLYTVNYFPVIKIDLVSPLSFLVYAAHTLLFLLPMLINIQEELKWRRLKSKI
ncbi:MAG: energy-coupling factor transporter transmembrane protein EcfT [Clostridiales bacterium]|nr:energy-coupling factor transporter transmembrane protein EcfT [Clostridiales bacterium]